MFDYYRRSDLLNYTNKAMERLAKPKEENENVEILSSIENLKDGQLLYFVDPDTESVLEVTYHEYGVSFQWQDKEEVRSKRNRVNISYHNGSGTTYSMCAYKNLYKDKEEAERTHREFKSLKKIRNRYISSKYIKSMFSAWKSEKHNADEIMMMLEKVINYHYGTPLKSSDVHWVEELYASWEKKNKDKLEHQIVFKDLIFNNFELNLDGRERGKSSVYASMNTVMYSE